MNLGREGQGVSCAGIKRAEGGRGVSLEAELWVLALRLILILKESRNPLMDVRRDGKRLVSSFGKISIAIYMENSLYTYL